MIWVKEKYLRHKPAQQGYKHPSDGGDSGHNKRNKLNAAARAKLPPQAQKTMVMRDAYRGSTRMEIL